MRDQWRAEDDYRYSDRRDKKGATSRRNISPASSRRGRDVDTGLKIKGRATADTASVSPSKKDKLGLEKTQDLLKKPSPSPERTRQGDEERAKHRRDSSRSEHAERPRYRNQLGSLNTRRRTRSRSPAREIFDFRDERRRPRSPSYSGRGSGRSDRFRPSSKRRERLRSPPRSSRGDYYSASYRGPDRLSGRSGDSYIPSSRRRSSPPARRRSRSTDRRPRSIRYSPIPSKRSESPTRTPRKGKSTAVQDQLLPRHSGHSPRATERPKRYRNSSRSKVRDASTKSARRRRSRTPANRDGGKGGLINMQNPTRPIQSILNDGSHPNSSPRRIPSFGSGSRESNTISQQFPLHGMKASDMHHRGSRPPQLNTQQSYSASPQWTPTSSHHGSPHSASSFNQGRGAWNGQQPHVQGQQG